MIPSYQLQLSTTILLFNSTIFRISEAMFKSPPHPTPRVADWFAQLNNKMGGDLKKIQVVGQYMVEVWRAIGMDLTKVEFLNASDEINARAQEYWSLVMDVAMKNSLSRVVRCS